MTLTESKDIVAKKYGYADWKDMHSKQRGAMIEQDYLVEAAVLWHKTEMDNNKDLQGATENTTVYCVYDCGGQGMRDNGLMGVFDNEKKVKEVIGDRWLTTTKVKINVLYEDGVR